MAPEHYTPQDVADLLSVAPKTLAEWRRQEEGPPWFKLGESRSATVRYPRVAFRAWLKMRRES